MLGKLAGLFAGQAPSQEKAANSELPVGPSRPASASGILEQLRALNDPDTVLQGLHNLRQRLRDTDADSLLVELVLSKHGHEALGTVWKSQGLVRNEDVSTALLLASAHVLKASQSSNINQPDRLALTETLDHFADSILARHAKYLQQQLASTVRNKASAVLYLLACIASRGGSLPAGLLKALDCDSTILVKLAHPPKAKKAEGTASKGGSLLRSWGDKDTLKRPSCALLVCLVQSVLRQADAVTTTAVVTSRALMAALLHHVSVHPHAVVIETLGIISSKVLGPAQGLPQHVQAEAFSDAALLQLSYISQREGGGPKAVEAAEAAQSVLMALGTDASHGMVPEFGGMEGHELSEHQAAAQPKASTGAGQARLLRLMHKLRVTEANHHAELLLAICAGSPPMASAYLANCTLALEPKAGSSRWLVAMTLVGRLVQSAAKGTNPFTGAIGRGHRPPAVGDPAVQAFLRLLAPACLPRAVLSKGIQHPDALVRYTTLCTLLKLVQTAQSALHKLQTDIHTLSALPAQAQIHVAHESGLTAPAQHSGPFCDSQPAGDIDDAVSAAAANAFATLQQQQQLDMPILSDNMQQQQAPSLQMQWTALHLQLQQFLRASLPDPQSLLAVLSTLAKPASQSPPEADAAADSLTHESSQDDSQLLGEALGSGPHTAVRQTDSSGMESKMSASELTSTITLMVLTAYQLCLPESMSDSHVDVFGLMPQDVLALPPLQQHALLELQLTAVPITHGPEPSPRCSEPPRSSLSASALNSKAALKSASALNSMAALNSASALNSRPALNSGSHPSSAASFLPVLKLLTGSASHAVRQLASQMLTRRMTDLLGGAFAPEVALWLGLLPTRPQEAEGSDAWSICTSGVLGFMSEALASLGRRPHHFWDLMKTLMEAHTSDPSPGAVKVHGDLEFSLLAVCALQQALKVACSSKLPSDSRTWISAYTAAVLSQLLKSQIDPQPLCHIIIGLFCQAADSKAGTSAADAVTFADTPQQSQQLNPDQSSNHAEHAVVLSLPREAQTLASLFSYAQDLLKRWQSTVRTANPRQQQQPGAQTLGANPGPYDTPEGSMTKKRRKAPGVDMDDVKNKKRKKQKHEALLPASPPHESESALQVEIISCGKVFRELESVAEQLKRVSKQGLGSSPQRRLRQQLHQQLLTALYQSPASFVEEELPKLVDLLESAQAGDELTHDGTELSVAVCRAFGMACPISCCMLPGTPFLLLLQGINRCEPGDALEGQLHSSFRQLPSDARPLTTPALMHQLQLVTIPAAIQLCFSLLGLSLGLTPPPKHPSKARMTKAEGQAAWEVVGAVDESAVDESAVDESAVDESAIRQLLQQQWVISHWLTERPPGHEYDVTVAWESGLTELLHSVLSLSLRAGSSALTDVCQPYMLRLISQLTAVLDQAASSTAAAPSTAAASSTAAAAAVVASDTESAVIAAASRLAIFLPQTHLLTLTHTGLTCVKPDSESNSITAGSKQGCMAKLCLSMAEALISTWTEQKGEENFGNTDTEGEVWDEGSKASWSDTITGLLRMALRCSRGSSEAEADVLLLKALHKSSASACDGCFSSCRQQLSQYLRLTLHSPSRKRGLIAAELVQLSTSLHAEFKLHYEAQLAGANKATQPIEKEAVAFLLPAAIKYLQLSKPAVHAAHAAVAQHSTAESASMTAAVSAAEQASGSYDDNIAEKGPTDAVRTFFAAQVRQFMTAKLKAPQGFDQVSEEAARNLHSHAVDALMLCWAGSPPEAADRQQLLHRLLPAKGWPLRPLRPPHVETTAVGSSCDPRSPAAESAWLPLPSQRAEVAKMLLEQSLQAGSMALEDLTRFAQACLVTLATAYKHQDLSHQSQLLVDQLTDYLDNFVGDHLAELPDQDRLSSPFTSLAGPISGFAAAVLKFKLDSPACIKVLRRLLAALLPDNTNDAMSGASDGQSSPGNPAVGAMASQTFDRLISHSRFVPVMLDLKDSLLPLPAAAQKLKLRSSFGSILPLVESAPCPQADTTVKGELAELLDTLLGLQQSYPPADPGPTPAHPLEQNLASLLPLLLASYGATLSSPDQSLLRVLLHINDMIFQTRDYQCTAGTAGSTAVAAAEAGQAAAAVLITEQQSQHLDGDGDEVSQIHGCIGSRDEDAGMGSGADRSTASDAPKAMPEGPEREGGGSEGPITALLHGPLAKAGFLWGATAKAAHEQALLIMMPQTDDKHHLTGRARLVGQHQQVDPVRCALSAIHFPEQRTLTADDTTAEPLPAALQKLAATARALEDRGNHRIADGDGAHRLAAATPASLHGPSDCLQNQEGNLRGSNKAGGIPGQVSTEESCAGGTVVRYHAAGHDPVWLLLYAVKGLQCQTISAEEMISQGLLSLSLRSLGAQDDGLRALAYEALGLCLAVLAVTSPKLTQQVQVLLEGLKRSLTRPFQRLPAVIALFAAEAVFVLMDPGSAMYSPVNKLLLKGPVLNLEEIPLMYQLLVSGNQQHVKERSWVLHLLAAGLRGPQDAQLYRRRFVAELLMSLHDSPLANAQIRKSVLQMLTAAVHVPAYAKDLINRAGLQTWLNSQCHASGLK